MALTRGQRRGGTDAEAIHDGILDIIQEFRQTVFRATNGMRNGALGQPPPAEVVDDLTGYVHGWNTFDALLRIFARSDPRYHGLYFPAPGGDELARWPIAATTAIEAVVALKTRPDDKRRSGAVIPSTNRNGSAPNGAGS